MNVPITLAKPDFLDWVERQEGRRYDLVRGHVVQQQAGGSIDHSSIAARMLGLLYVQVTGASWRILTGDLAIDVSPENYRFPEISVIRTPVDGTARSTGEPVVLVEVTSPSSISTDFGDKANEYLALASLEAYVIASQDRAQVWVWTRAPAATATEERPFPAVPVEITQHDDVLAIGAIGFRCTLGDIYDGIL